MALMCEWLIRAGNSTRYMGGEGDGSKAKEAISTKLIDHRKLIQSPNRKHRVLGHGETCNVRTAKNKRKTY
jgi:hypothetical protein